MITHSKRLQFFGEYFFSKANATIKKAESSSGRKVINLGIGSPDLPPSDELLEFAKTTLDDPSTHRYPSYTGEDSLRSAVAKYYRRRFGVTVDPATQILPLIGSKEGLVHACLAFLDPGDVALVPDPGYPAYSAGPLLAGASLQTYSLTAGNDWLPNLDEIAKLDLSHTKLWWLGYPNNPTGAVAPLKKMAEWVAFARAHHLFIIYDNPYADVFFGSKNPQSILKIPGALEVAMEFNSLSKSHNLAGWRIGMAISNATAISALLTIKSNVDTGIFPLVQRAATFALNETSDEWMKRRNQIYASRAKAVCELCNELGWRASAPQAGLYVWAEIPETITDVAKFCLDLVKEAQVFITPGITFGAQGARYVRISLCQPVDQIAEASTRIKSFYFYAYLEKGGGM